MDDEYEYLKSKYFLRTVKDKLVITKENSRRRYEHATVTKFLTPKIKIYEFLDELTKPITGDYLMYIDFHFLVNCRDVESLISKPTELNLRLQTGQKYSAINPMKKVCSLTDLNTNLDFFKGLSHHDILSLVMKHHTELYDYTESGLRPHLLLSLVVAINKIPSITLAV